jgi:hypothetical protein
MGPRRFCRRIAAESKIEADIHTTLAGKGLPGKASCHIPGTYATVEESLVARFPPKTIFLLHCSTFHSLLLL